jgi:hypothetical protein
VAAVVFITGIALVCLSSRTSRDNNQAPVNDAPTTTQSTPARKRRRSKNGKRKRSRR